MRMRERARVLVTDRDGCATAYLLSDFAVGGVRLRPEHKAFLDQRVMRIVDAPGVRVRLIGRASSTGPERHNERLAARRAQEVSRYLVGRGAAPDRLATESRGESTPLASSGEHPDERSVEIRVQVAAEFLVVLRDVSIVRNTRVLIERVESELRPIAQRAGRTLKVTRSILGNSEGDVTLTFNRGGHETRPCGVLFLGEEGGGNIWVGAHEDLRVCGSPRLTDQGVDYVPTIQRAFDPEEPLFAHFVANTVLHEIGHILASLPHTSDPDNYLFSKGSTGANLPRAVRNRDRMREHFAGKKSYSAEQIRKMACAIRSAHYAGGMQLLLKP